MKRACSASVRESDPSPLAECPLVPGALLMNKHFIAALRSRGWKRAARDTNVNEAPTPRSVLVCKGRWNNVPQTGRLKLQLFLSALEAGGLRPRWGWQLVCLLPRLLPVMQAVTSSLCPHMIAHVPWCPICV